MTSILFIYDHSHLSLFCVTLVLHIIQEKKIKYEYKVFSETIFSLSSLTGAIYALSKL